MSFNSQIDKFEDIALAKFLEFHKTVAIYGYSRLQRNSPVWTGRYRASHRIAINQLDASVEPPLPNAPIWPTPPPNQIAAQSLAGARIILNTLKPFDNVILSNSVEYARELEFGKSNQAPSGIYSLTLSDLNQRYGRARL